MLDGLNIKTITEELLTQRYTLRHSTMKPASTRQSWSSVLSTTHTGGMERPPSLQAQVSSAPNAWLMPGGFFFNEKELVQMRLWLARSCYMQRPAARTPGNHSVSWTASGRTKYLKTFTESLSTRLPAIA